MQLRKYIAIGRKRRLNDADGHTWYLGESTGDGQFNWR